MPMFQLGYGCESITQPQDSYEHGVCEEASFHAAAEDRNGGCADGEYEEGSVNLSGLTAKARMYQLHRPKHQQAQYV